MKIQLEDAGPIWIAWPLDDAAAHWLRVTNVGAVQRCWRQSRLALMLAVAGYE